MGLFSRGDRPRRPLDLFQVAMITVGAVIVLQIVGLILNTWFGVKKLSLGPGFLIMFIAVAAIATLAMAKKIFEGEPIDKSDLVTFLIVIIATGLLVYFIEDLVPQVFSAVEFKTAIQSILSP